MSIDIELERLPNGQHDLALRNFDLQLVRDAEHIRQNLAIRLQFFFEEWFLDSTEGVRYIDFVFVANPNLQNISSIMKATIQETAGVNAILRYTQTLDRRNRKLSIAFKVDTIFGPIEDTQTIGVTV